MSRFLWSLSWEKIHNRVYFLLSGCPQLLSNVFPANVHFWRLFPPSLACGYTMPWKQGILWPWALFSVRLGNTADYTFRCMCSSCKYCTEIISTIFSISLTSHTLSVGRERLVSQTVFRWQEKMGRWIKHYIQRIVLRSDIMGEMLLRNSLHWSQQGGEVRWKPGDPRVSRNT